MCSMEEIQQEHIEYLAEYLDDMSWLGLKESILINRDKGRLADNIAAELLIRADTLENGYAQFPEDLEELYALLTASSEDVAVSLSN